MDGYVKECLVVVLNHRKQGYQRIHVCLRAVNGPGEAREADVGIAGGIGEGLLFRRGEIIAKVPEDKLIDRLIEEIKTMKGKD